MFEYLPCASISVDRPVAGNRNARAWFVTLFLAYRMPND